MNKYLQLFRFANGLMGITGVIAGALIAAGLDAQEHWFRLAVASAVVVLFMGGGNALNDYVDRDIDVVSHPERPVPSGRMRPREALYAGAGAFAASVAVSFLLWDAVSIIIVLAACALMLSYELRLKQRGLIGNVTIAVLTGMLFLLGGAVTGNVANVAAMAAMAAMVSIGREIAKDIEDMGGDEGRRTLPMRIGVKKAGIVGSVMIIAGVALSIWPLITKMFGPLYYIIAAADALFIYASYIMSKNAHTAQKMCKAAMFVALVAFMLGAVYT